jgi:hypothetical protein
VGIPMLDEINPNNDKMMGHGINGPFHREKHVPQHNTRHDHGEGDPNNNTMILVVLYTILKPRC